MACDEWVLGRRKETDRLEYGEAILRAASQPRSKWFIRAGMAESKSGLARRIHHLTNVHPRGMGALAAILAIGTAALLLLSPGWAEENPPQPPVKSPAGNLPFIEIESKFVEMSMTPEAARAFFQTEQIDAETILSANEAMDLLIRLDRQKGVDIVSAPRVTTKSGQRATIQIVREFAYPTEFDPPKTSRKEFKCLYGHPSSLSNQSASPLMSNPPSPPTTASSARSIPAWWSFSDS